MLCRPRPVCSSRSGSTEATLLAVMCALGMMVAGGFYFFQADMAREVAMQAETDAVAAEKATRGEVEIQAETALAEAPREEVVELPITEPEIDTDNPLDDVLDDAAKEFAALARSDAAIEGMTAFMQRRKPAWATKPNIADEEETSR